MEARNLTMLTFHDLRNLSCSSHKDLLAFAATRVKAQGAHSPFTVNAVLTKLEWHIQALCEEPWSSQHDAILRAKLLAFDNIKAVYQNISQIALDPGAEPTLQHFPLDVI